jgi:DNA-binding NtrC family response regulator
MAQSVIAVLPTFSDSTLIQDSLGREGIAVHIVPSPEEALRLLREGPDSVILYDGDTGQPWPDALRNFLAIQPTARVVLVMRSAGHQTWLDLFDNGGFDLLLRPLQPLDLRAVVRCALDPPKFFHAAAA